MLSIFRGKLAKRLAAGVFGIVAIAFIITGVSTGGIGGGGGELGGGDTIAKVGGETIGADEAEQRARRALAGIARQQPGVDMPSFVAQGGLDQTIEQLIAAEAMTLLGRREGIVASRKLVDGEIAGVPAFAGPTGRFDQQTFRAALAAQHVTEDKLRAEIDGDLVRRQLLLPIAGAGRTADAIASAYAALLLEQRRGRVAIVPNAALAGGASPNDAEIAAFYKAHLAAFTTPERRVLRYAPIGRDQVAAGAVPGDAEIAAVYAGNAAAYAARETRTLEQVVLDSEAKAQALAARVNGGQSFADAAKAAGFSAGDIALGAKSRAEFAALSSPEVAAAAFAVAQGGIGGPVRSPFGWHVVHVVKIARTPGRSLAEARGEIAADLVKRKQDVALTALVNGIEDKVSSGASFADIVKANGLAVVTTPPLLASGQASEATDANAGPPSPEIAALVRPGFAAGPDDPPSVQAITAGERYALLSTAQLLPPRPRPLAQVREQVAAAIGAERATARARAVAQAIAAKVNAGVGLDKAIAAAGTALPPARPAAAVRGQLAQQGGAQVPDAVRALFALRVGKARLVPMPQGAGWFVVALDTVTPGAGPPARLVASTGAELSRSAGEEYVEQFARAAQASVGVTRREDAIGALRMRLLGAAPAGQ